MSSNTVVELLDDDSNITDEDLCEGDIQTYLNDQNVKETRSFAENQISTQETNNNDYDDQNINKTNDANKNSLSFENNNDKHLEEEDNVQKSQKRNLPKISAIQVLKKKISIPLQEKRKSSCNQSNLENINKRCKLPKGKENNSSSKKSLSTSTISSRMSVFNILAESKTELVQFMKKDLQTKSEVEVQILNMQLKKEELEVQLLEKELLLKDHILKKELQK